MLLNYFKLSCHLLIRNPFFTCINVLGLSIGFAAFYILWPYSQSELNSDSFHKDYDHIARLSRHLRWTDDDQNWNELLFIAVLGRIHRIAWTGIVFIIVERLMFRCLGAQQFWFNVTSPPHFESCIYLKHIFVSN